MQYDSTVTTNSLYVHWPFCPYKCHFCPFVAIAGHDAFMQRYHQALCKELLQYAQQAGRQTLNTIFLGGGTPSTYPNELLLDMFGILKDKFVFCPLAEITIEVNPGTVKVDQLAYWKQVGINRLSIGVQSLKDSVLKSLNRHQSAQQVTTLLESACIYFDNISVDLILGLPGVEPDEWKDLINCAMQWPIKHISIYFLTIHENTPLYFKVQQKQVDLPPDESIIPLYHWTVETLAGHGFEQYELSNFAKRGYESRHNSVYWQRKPYKGVGLGACSFDGTARFQNEKNLMKYMQALEEGREVICTQELLSPEQIRLEKLMLHLRQRSGLSLEEMMEGLGSDDQQECQKKVQHLIDHNFLEKRDEKIILTPTGLLLENQVVLKLVGA